MPHVTGHYITTRTAEEEVRAFVPEPLPPVPPLALEGELAVLLATAEMELAKLNVAAEMVPSPEWFIYGFVRKEAVISSQIEGTQATLMDLLAYEAESSHAPGADVLEVCNYLDALQHGRDQLADAGGLPLSLRLLREIHARLLHGSRGALLQPGEFRRSQNWIGGTRPGNAVFVPPPPEQMAGCLDALERYLYAEDPLPPLARVGLIHVQFETIHPFLDGNGRLGRLLIALLLEHWQLLDMPLLYLSLYFKRHRQEYYERLNAVRFAGDWQGWLRFFLEGVATVGREATRTARALFTLFETDRGRLLHLPQLSVQAVRLLQSLPGHPVLTVAHAVHLLGTTKPTATKAIAQLADLGVLHETSGRRRDRTFAYRAYLDILSEGTELPASSS